MPVVGFARTARLPTCPVGECGSMGDLVGSPGRSGPERRLEVPPESNQGLRPAARRVRDDSFPVDEIYQGRVGDLASRRVACAPHRPPVESGRDFLHRPLNAWPFRRSSPQCRAGVSRHESSVTTTSTGSRSARTSCRERPRSVRMRKSPSRAGHEDGPASMYRPTDRSVRVRAPVETAARVRQVQGLRCVRTWGV